jgi:uncharacterized membrane protein YhaH (DUF805 family)
MKGNVIGFDPDTNTGAISGHDGRRYDFATADWHSSRRPRRGDLVDFAPDNQRATQIYAMEAEYVAPSFGAFYFSPAGRISRSQFWLRFFLPWFIISIILNIIARGTGEAGNIILNIWLLVALWPSIAVFIKRIHDRNKSGALVWALIGPEILAIIFSFISGIAVASALNAGQTPEQAVQGAATVLMITLILWIITGIVGIWFFIEFGCMRGTIGPNQYGSDPVPPQR